MDEKETQPKEIKAAFVMCSCGTFKSGTAQECSSFAAAHVAMHTRVNGDAPKGEGQ